MTILVNYLMLISGGMCSLKMCPVWKWIRNSSFVKAVSFESIEPNIYSNDSSDLVYSASTIFKIDRNHGGKHERDDGKIQIKTEFF